MWYAGGYARSTLNVTRNGIIQYGRGRTSGYFFSHLFVLCNDLHVRLKQFDEIMQPRHRPPSDSLGRFNSNNITTLKAYHFTFILDACLFCSTYHKLKLYWIKMHKLGSANINFISKAKIINNIFRVFRLFVCWLLIFSKCIFHCSYEFLVCCEDTYRKCNN